MTSLGKAETNNFNLGLRVEFYFYKLSGIFLNYTWNEEKLAATRLMAYESQTDKDRSLSVYAGVDVFGRGAFGGGEMKSFLAGLS